MYVFHPSPEWQQSTFSYFCADSAKNEQKQVCRKHCSPVGEHEFLGMEAISGMNGEGK